MFAEMRKDTPLWDSMQTVATPIARQISRLMREEAASSEEFDAATYLAEVILKYELIVSLGILSTFDRRESERLGYGIVSADGLGIWADALPKVLNALTVTAKGEYLGYTRAFLRKISSPDQDYANLEAARQIWSELEESEFSFSRSRLGVLQFFVALRNRTRGHGATTRSQYEAINGLVIDVLAWLVESSPFAKEDLLRPMKVKEGGVFSCRVLRGYPTQEQTLVPSPLIPDSGLLYFRTPNGPVPLPDFLRYAREDDSCFFLNSKRKRANSESDFLDYMTNGRQSFLVTWYESAPQEKPVSVTAGRDQLDWDSTPVHNLPKIDFTTYVRRPKLESELESYLTGKAINFTSLRGHGGAGKTTLALRVARQIINAQTSESAPFDFIIWFSARDIDLDERAGPLARRRQVTSLSSCAALFMELMREYYSPGPEAKPEDLLARALSDAKERFLLIFDNFESFDDTAPLQQFIKRNLAYPSKALMTSREDAFHGDVPIEVGGLTRDESSDLIRKTARQANCEPRITEHIISKIFDTTLGNPYAIKLLVNEFSRSNDIDLVLPKALNEDYLSALFRRGFERLEDGPAYLFLLVCLSPLAHYERFARLGCVGRSIDYLSARKAILDSHLLDPPDSFEAGDGVFRVSWAAQQFAKRILVGHRTQREVESDIAMLDLVARDLTPDVALSVLANFIESTPQVSSSDPQIRERNRKLLAWAREHDPQASKDHALQLFREHSDDAEGTRAAFKRAVELNSTDPEIWLEWARFEQTELDFHRALDLTLRAVDFVDDEQSLHSAARETLAIMSEESVKATITLARRRVYTEALIARLESIRSELSARSLAALAWLYLLSNDRKRALAAAEEGNARSPGGNGECQKIMSKTATQ